MNAKINITYRDKDNNIIENPIEGQRAYSPETKKLYIYTNNKWELVTGESSLGLTMYDINKQLISQLPILNQEQQLEAIDSIQKFLNESNNHYYMLLCKEISYYTVFVLKDESMCPQQFSLAVDEILACAEYIGDIKSVNRDNDADGIEIWVHPRKEDSEPIVMYLFGYDAGIIECIR